MFDLSGEHVDRLVGLIDPGKHRRAQQGVMLVEPSREGVFEPVNLGSHPPFGHVGEDLGVALTGNQRVDHLPARFRQHRRSDR